MSQSNGTAAPTSSGQGRNAVNLHLAKVEEFIADPKRTKGQLAEMVEISKSYNQDDRQSYVNEHGAQRQRWSEAHDAFWDPHCRLTGFPLNTHPSEIAESQ